MSSQRRIDASRANGARSRGPVTADGKERSSRNAVRHGLLARNIIIGGEEAGQFQVLLAAYIERFQPADPVEESLVEQMAAADWRQQRSWAIEAAIINDRIAASSAATGLGRMTEAFTVLAAGPELSLMHRYESRQSRLFYRALHNLELLRRSRPPEEPDAEPNEELPNEPSPISEHSPAPLALVASPDSTPVAVCAPIPIDSLPTAPAPDPAPDPRPPARAVTPFPTTADFEAALRRLRALGVPGY